MKVADIPKPIPPADLWQKMAKWEREQRAERAEKRAKEQADKYAKEYALNDPRVDVETRRNEIMSQETQAVEKSQTFRVGEENLTAEEVWGRLAQIDPKEPAGRSTDPDTGRPAVNTKYDFLCAARHNPSWVEMWAKTLSNREKGLRKAFNNPASLLIIEQLEVTDQLKEQRRLTELMDAQRRLYQHVVRLSPEERTSYFETFGVPKPLAKLHELDLQVMSAGPDTKITLRKYATIHQKLREGYDPTSAANQGNVVVERQLNRQQNINLVNDVTKAAREELAAKVSIALEATNGNKTVAARLLGISRDKVQRLSGVTHLRGEHARRASQ